MAGTSQETVTFDVEGMTCASCALRIERVLTRQDGVTDAAVSFAGREARVTITDGTDVAGLEAAVARLGYAASVADRADRRSVVDAYDEETRVQRRNASLAFAFTLPAFLLTMLGPDADWVTIIVWALVTPVEFVFGWQFHRNAALRLRSGGPAESALRR